MDSAFADELLPVCEILNRNDIQYLIVGGTAVALHGYFRMSMNDSGRPADKYDFDFWFNPTYENYFKLLKAFEDLGLDVSKFKEEIAPNPRKSFFRFESDHFTMDFLPDLPGLSNFRKSYNVREVGALKGVEIFFISYDDLILNKRTNARPKDLNDIEHLKSYRSTNQ